MTISARRFIADRHGLRRRSASVVALLLGAWMIAGTSGSAEQRRPAPARPAVAVPAPVAADPTLSSKILSNGLEVIVFEDHSLPLVTAELAVRNGSFTEPPELNGLSHLYEHMFFKSNRATESGEPYTRNLGELGFLYNATTTEEAVTYYVSTTSPNLDYALRYLRDSVRYPSFNPEELTNEETIVVDELRRQLSNPYSLLNREMTTRLFYKYPSRKLPSGNEDTVRSATPATMRLIQGRYYVPNNSAMIVAGDAKPEAVFATVEALYGDWPRRAVDPFVEFPLVEHPPLPASAGKVVTGPIQNVVVEIGWHGPSIGKDNAATYAADVFSWILRQPDSHFQRALVDSGLATGVYLGYFTQRNVGPITATFQTSPDKVKAATAALYKEIAQFTSPTYFTDEELENAKVASEADSMFDREKPSEFVHTIAFWWASTGLEYYRSYLGGLRATTRADINRFINTYITGKPHIGISLMSEDSARSSGLTERDLIGAAR